MAARRIVVVTAKAPLGEIDDYRGLRRHQSSPHPRATKAAEAIAPARSGAARAGLSRRTGPRSAYIFGNTLAEQLRIFIVAFDPPSKAFETIIAPDPV